MTHIVAGAVRHIVVGLGEVGSAILECLVLHRNDVMGVDVEDRHEGTCEYLHICFPGDLEGFNEAVLGYIEEYSPGTCIIHSTVLPGTTREIQRRTTCLMAYSPVRGRHGQLVKDLHDFTKLVGAPLESAAHDAATSLIEAGFTVTVMKDAISLELGKLFQTTYTGILVAWAQEMQRYCDEVGADFMTAQRVNEMPNLPHVIHQPGFIGGHCIIPNTAVLDRIRPGGLFTNVVRLSNEDVESPGTPGRLWPIPYRQNK